MAGTSRRSLLRLGSAAALGTSDVLVSSSGSAADGPVVSCGAFGLRGDGRQDNAEQIEHAFQAALASGTPLHLPAGRYRLERPLVLDVAPARWKGFQIIGAGRQSSILDFSAVDLTGPALTVCCNSHPGDAFYAAISDLGIICRSDGPALQVGKDDFSDAHNAYELRRLTINNGAMTGTPVGLRLNNVLNSAIDVVVNCETRERGIALQMRRVQFCMISGAQGHAAMGTRVDGTYSYGNVFSAIDYEELGLAVQIVDPHATRNTWIGGTVADTGKAFDFQTGIGNKIINMNLAVADRDVLVGSIGVHLDLPQARLVATPAVPASGQPVRNGSGQTLRVAVMGGAVETVEIDGTVMADGAVSGLLLSAGESITLNYKVVPRWSWLPLS